jgi:hypothetical protein
MSVGSFGWVSTILSMILGIGVTILLTESVAALRARGAGRVAWVPLVWAACIFLTQIQFWWGINQLSAGKPVWSFEEFLGLVALTILLFLSAALLMPTNDQDRRDIGTFFRTHGRWALVALTVFHAGTFLVNWLSFGVSPLALWAVLHVVVAVLPLAAFFQRSPGWLSWATWLALPFYLLDFILVSDDRLTQLVL